MVFNNRSLTSFIFIGGTTIAYVLEYTLSIIMELYSYKNIPIVFFEIPIVIPCGWVVTFYSLYRLSLDLVNSKRSAILLVGFSGMLFGHGIETLAKHSDFWVFHFEFVEFFGVPLNVMLAWAFSTANFAAGITIFEKYYESMRWSWFPILLLIHIINITIAYALS